MTFGDSEPDDAFDPTAPADPVQVARRHHDYRQLFDGGPDWDDLTDEQRAVGVEVMRRLLARLRREGAIDG